MLADAQGARVAAYLLDGDATGAATSRRTSWSATVRRCAPRRRPATSTSGPRRSTPRWARRCGPADPAVDVDARPRAVGDASTRSSSWAELDDDLGAAQVDYDDDAVRRAVLGDAVGASALMRPSRRG